MVTWWRCDADGIHPGAADADMAVQLERLPDDGFLWIELNGEPGWRPAWLEAELGLSAAAVADALSPHHRPRFDGYRAATTLVVSAVSFQESTADVTVGGVGFAIGSRVLLSASAHRADLLATVRQRWRPGAMPGRGPVSVVYAALDVIVAEGLVAAQRAEAAVTRMEREVFSPGRVNRIETLYRLEREILEFDDAVRPMADVADALLSHHGDHDRTRAFLRDLAHRVKRVGAAVERGQNLLTAIVQAHLGQIGMWQNEDMRKISAWAAIVAAPTLIAGIYGMNFEHMPELKWAVSYPAVLVVMLVVCALLYRGFRRNGWL